jgi:hypothetical protein
VVPIGTIAGTLGRIFTGGCHCGQVRFRLEGPLRQGVICHCTDCLRVAGNSWGSTGVPMDRFELTAAETLSWYQSSAWAERGFCGHCGTSMFYHVKNKPFMAIAVGMIDACPKLDFAGQIFAGSFRHNPLVGDVDVPHLDEALFG